MTAIALPVVQSLEEVEDINRSSEILTLNPELLTMLAKNQQEDLLRQFSLCTIDSAPLTTLLKFKGVQAGRYPGVDLVADLLLQYKSSKKFLLFGAKPGVAARLAERYGLENAMVFDGYSAAVDEVIQKCREQNFFPDVALVAMGGLLQFQVTKVINKELEPRITVACGGSFDVLSGDIPRAPGWMQRVGLEWAFRVALQPARISRLGGVMRGLFLARQVIVVEGCRKKIKFRI
jgi:N-acetylglucosaminyldiphosphoundecaprenol N-acetyl-beta-D-mannosaminyltransferase